MRTRSITPLSRHLAVAVLVAGLSAAFVGCKSESNAKASSDKEASADKEPSADEEASADKEPSSDEEVAAAEKGAKETKKADLPEDMQAGTTQHFGADFQSDGEPITLATAVEKHADAKEQIKVAANIKKVCKKKGCWFTLSGEGVDKKVRVRMKDYGFFVPRNTDGAEVVVEGKLERRTMSEKEAKHYAQDQGKDPASIDADDLKVLEFTASGVRITKQS